LILYDTNTLSLISTVTPGISKAVIEHEIIFIKKKIIFGIWYMIKNTSITIHTYYDKDVSKTEYRLF
jgi:hypothetical protein